MKRSVNCVPLSVNILVILKAATWRKRRKKSVLLASVWLIGHAQIDPARSPVYGDEQIAAIVLVGHLRPVLDVDVHKARHVVLEGLLGCLLAFFFASSLIFKCASLANPARRSSRLIPKAQIRDGRSHVVVMANASMDSVRREELKAQPQAVKEVFGENNARQRKSLAWGMRRNPKSWSERPAGEMIRCSALC